MYPCHQPDAETQTLLASLQAFCFPDGEDAARPVLGVKTTQRGELRMSPEARWGPFTAEQRIDATQSEFCWDARFGGSRLGSYVVTDAYEKGHGRLTIKLGGVLTVKKVTGPEVDRGEIQRYLSSFLMCPSILLHHRSLQFALASKRTLQVRDTNDSTGATVEIEFGEDGLPLGCRAHRPRLVGKSSVVTPWFATCLEYEEREGMRVAHRIEAGWTLPEGDFTYFREEVTSFTSLR
jgi:hypothetical protein